MLRYFLLICVVEYIAYCAAIIFGKRYWNGPQPTKKENDEHSRWMIGFLECWPNSPLAAKYKNEAARAHAYKAYLQLQERHERGEVDDIDYQRELSRILPLIDVQDDIAQLRKKP